MEEGVGGRPLRGGKKGRWEGRRERL